MSLPPFWKATNLRIVTNRGLTDDPPDTHAWKAAVQKKIILERIFGFIAQFAPFFCVMRS